MNNLALTTGRRNGDDYGAQFVPEEIEGRTPARVVEPIGNDEEIGVICDHMLVKALVCRRLDCRGQKVQDCGSVVD